MKRYYAIRFPSMPKMSRIEGADDPATAARLAFGRGTRGLEYKDLGTRVKIIQTRTKLMALLNESRGWVKFLDSCGHGVERDKCVICTPPKLRAGPKPGGVRLKYDIPISRKNREGAEPTGEETHGFTPEDRLLAGMSNEDKLVCLNRLMSPPDPAKASDHRAVLCHAANIVRLYKLHGLASNIDTLAASITKGLKP